MATEMTGTKPARAIPADAVPCLPRGVRLKQCRVRDAWFLLAPERAMKLDDTGVAVLSALDGEQSFAAIVAALAAKYGAPAAVIATDAEAFLAELQARRMVELR